jgi:hypothetical protein
MMGFSVELLLLLTGTARAYKCPHNRRSFLAIAAVPPLSKTCFEARFPDCVLLHLKCSCKGTKNPPIPQEMSGEKFEFYTF